MATIVIALSKENTSDEKYLQFYEESSHSSVTNA